MEENQALYDMSILIADDLKEDQDIIKVVLEQAGFKKLKIVDSGKEALDLLGLDKNEKIQKAKPKEHFDLVILDVFLGDAIGFVICKLIKDSDLDLPVILLSGGEIEDIKTNLLRSKADNFLTKPFQIEELSARVKMLLLKRLK